MSDISWNFAKENLCVICKKSLDSPSYHICTKCHKICDIQLSEISKEIMDAKSKCCNADVDMHQKITCGDNCHEKFILEMIKEYGSFKKVIDQETKIAYKVPTRKIIEEGLQFEDLTNYPKWK